MPPEPVDVVPLLSAAKVTVVAGKGGVGKTTVTALLARAAADAGRRVIAVELDGKPTLAELVGDVPLLALSAPLALEEYLREHGFGRVAKRLAASGVIDVVSTAAPGIDDLVVLGKIKQLERSGDWDTIVVDGPAAGHAVTLLTSPAGLRDAVSSGPVRAQAEDVLAMLGDAGRCQVALVTLAETTPVNETIETAFRIEDRVGVKLTSVFVNAVDAGAAGADRDLPITVERIESTIARLDVDAGTAAALGSAALFRAERRRVQQAALDQLEHSLPLDQLHVPYVPGRLDGAAVALLARDVRRAQTGSGAEQRAGR
jgi:anion-transporting  ArsA/GET3 family ATPase